MSIQKIVQAIKEFDTIIIHRHVRPDPDAYGSQAGLKELIKQSFPTKKVYLVGQEDPSLHFLVRMDEVTDDTYKNALVVVCDTANTDRIDDQRYKLGKKLIKIDHHPNNDPYGDLLWVDTNASSTSELIYELYLYGQELGLQLNDNGARLIYAGIIGDTGRFMFSNTTEKTFIYAADLVTYHFDREKLYAGIYSISDNIARLRGYVLQNFTLTPSGVSTVELSQEILKKYHIQPLESGKLISILGDIEGMKAWAFFIEEDEDTIRVRLRSKGPVINDIASKFGGGGHPLAAGATISDWQSADEITQDLERVCREFNQQ